MSILDQNRLSAFGSNYNNIYIYVYGARDSNEISNPNFSLHDLL